jgi:hypothetical protein
MRQEKTTTTAGVVRIGVVNRPRSEAKSIRVIARYNNHGEDFESITPPKIQVEITTCPDVFDKTDSVEIISCRIVLCVPTGFNWLGVSRLSRKMALRTAKTPTTESDMRKYGVWPPK